MLPYISIVFLVILFGVQIFLRSFLSERIKGVGGIIGVVYIGVLLVYSHLQYYGWLSNGITELLLPPYTSIFYFLQYVFFKIWFPHIVSFLFAVSAFCMMKWMNKKKKGILFFDDEYYIAAIAIFLSGYPGVLVYIPLFFLVYAFILIFQRRKYERFSSYFLWFPVALCAILVSKFILEGTILWTLLLV